MSEDTAESPPMWADSIPELYSEGTPVFSPYGIAVVADLQYPLDSISDAMEMESHRASTRWVTDIYVHGHGIETIEATRLIPLTDPVTIALVNLFGGGDQESTRLGGSQ